MVASGDDLHLLKLRCDEKVRLGKGNSHHCVGERRFRSCLLIVQKGHKRDADIGFKSDPHLMIAYICLPIPATIPQVVSYAVVGQWGIFHAAEKTSLETTFWEIMLIIRLSSKMLLSLPRVKWSAKTQKGTIKPECLQKHGGGSMNSRRRVLCWAGKQKSSQIFCKCISHSERSSRWS